MGKKHLIQEEMIIKELAALKILADPTRLQIVRNLDTARTVKELADRLDIPATKLYYHVNQLEKHNIIRVVETRVVSGIIEKRYQVTAKRYHVSESLLKATEGTEENLETLLTAIFDTAKEEMRRSVLAGLLNLSERDVAEEREGGIWQASLRLTLEQFAELNGRLQTIIDEFETLSGAEVAQDTQHYGLMIAAYPIVQSQEKADE